MSSIKDKVIDEIKKTDFTNWVDLQLIADCEDIELDGRTITGIEVVKYLITYMSGCQFYIPHINSFEEPIKRFIDNNKDVHIKKIASAIGASSVRLAKLKREGTQQSMNFSEGSNE